MSSILSKSPRVALDEIRAEQDRRAAMACETSYYRFIPLAFSQVEAGTLFRDNWHIGAMAEHLQAVVEGDIRRLIINIPPRCMKSISTAVALAPWTWGPKNKPNKKFLYASYAQTLSIRDSTKSRRLINSAWYQRHWGDRFVLAGDQNQKTRFETDASGYRLATSVDGTATGEGGDIIVIDDAHSAAQVHSELERQNTLDWWDQTMSTRLNDAKTGAFIVIMQRLHESDLTGHILQTEFGEWDHLVIPMEYERKHIFHIRSSLGFRDPRTKDGELLWPERFGLPEVKSLKGRLRHEASGQLQQRPSPAEGGRYKRDWFRYCTFADGIYTLSIPDGSTRRVAEADCTRLGSADLAQTEKKTSDYTSRIVADVTRSGDIIIRDLWRAQAESPAVEQVIRGDFDRWNIWQHGIESAHWGKTLIQNMRRDGLRVKSLKPGTQDKVARSAPAESAMESGRVYFMRDLPQLDELEKELLNFPNATHDDCVDSLAWMVYHASTLREPGVVYEEFRPESMRDGGHLIGMDTLPSKWPIWVLIQPGAYSGALMVTADPCNTLIVFDEFYGQNATADAILQGVSDMMLRHRRTRKDLRGVSMAPDYIYNPKRQVMAAASVFAKHGWNVGPWLKGDDHAADISIRERIINGKMLVHERCKHLIDEMLHFRRRYDANGDVVDGRFVGQDYLIRPLRAAVVMNPSGRAETKIKMMRRTGV